MPLILEVILILAVATVTGGLSLRWLRGSHSFAHGGIEGDKNAISLLFDQGVLHHATSAAVSRLMLHPGQHEWCDMRDAVIDRFPTFPDSAGLGSTGSVTLSSDAPDDMSRAYIRWKDDLCWVTFVKDDTAGLRHDLMPDAELSALRMASDTAPYPIWQTDATGRITWTNAAYETLRLLSGRSHDPDGTHLFPDVAAAPSNRVVLETDPNAQPDWYEITSVHIGDMTIFHAPCVTKEVEAEEAQRNFVQTLAKTFAQLSIGLAIFDRNGQLVLFNPALVDLTGLSAQFLSGRPTVMSFFDALRENRRMPEPKSYKTWRHEIAEVIAAAADGRYQETWSLESGQTYNVQGRPHPDGATAFLIEDISAEVTLTRNFRAELELSQSLLETLDDGLAVFSRSGVLTFCNQRFRDIWHLNPERSFADVTLTDSLNAWRQKSTSDTAWDDLENTIMVTGDRESWQGEIVLTSGDVLGCQAAPIASTPGADRGGTQTSRAGLTLCTCSGGVVQTSCAHAIA